MAPRRSYPASSPISPHCTGCWLRSVTSDCPWFLCVGWTSAPAARRSNDRTIVFTPWRHLAAAWVVGDLTRLLGKISPKSSNTITPLQSRLHPCPGWHATVWAAPRSGRPAGGHGDGGGTWRTSGMRLRNMPPPVAGLGDHVVGVLAARCWRSGGSMVLFWGPGRAAARRLPRGDRTAVEDLAAPDPAGLTAFERAGEAESADGARPAVRLGQLQVGRQLRKPQLRVLALAWQRPVYFCGLFGLNGEGAKRHGVVLAGG